MRTLLQIGEVATLLGVTQKTIRHYHKVGLLAEPPRSEGGYRLYTAQDLLRLQRIRRLQSLGLSLKQIKTLLGELVSERERTLREVLQSLLEELSTEIQTLQERRERIETLLSENALATLEQLPAASPTLEYVKEHLGEQLANVSQELWEIDAKIYAQLDTFHWPEDYYAGLKELVQYLAQHPEQYQQLQTLAERIVALAHVPEDSPEVERLLEDLTQVGGVFELMAKMSTFSAQAPQMASVFGDMMADLTVSTLSPAQKRFLAEMSRRQSDTTKRENT